MRNTHQEAVIKADKARHYACWTLRSLARNPRKLRVAAAQVLLDAEQALYCKRTRFTAWWL